MDNKAIFIGGIHGVGKTTLCGELKKKLGIGHHSASSLIKSLKNDDEDSFNKQVENIGGNQKLLITAISKYVDGSSPYLLDGHFCLLDTNNAINKVPFSTFKDISPAGIILLHDSIENIQNKIKGRDGKKYKSNLLLQFQDSEIKYSKEVADELKIPYISFNISNDITLIIDFVKNLIGR